MARTPGRWSPGCSAERQLLLRPGRDRADRRAQAGQIVIWIERGEDQGGGPRVMLGQPQRRQVRVLGGRRVDDRPVLSAPLLPHAVGGGAVAEAVALGVVEQLG